MHCSQIIHSSVYELSTAPGFCVISGQVSSFYRDKKYTIKWATGI